MNFGNLVGLSRSSRLRAANPCPQLLLDLSQSGVGEDLRQSILLEEVSPRAMA
jgi:hypothetical protein